MIKSNRLDFIASLIDKNSNTLLDIGTDHGYLIKKAFDSNKIKSGIAADVNELPLKSARRNLKDYNVKYVLSNGFKEIKDKFDVVVIAGMGGNLISKILSDAPKYKNIKYILQPNNKEENLRYFLMKNNFLITNEHVLLDKTFYVILEVKKGEMVLNKEELFLGPILKNKESSNIYYKHLYNWYKEIVAKHNLKSGNLVEKLKILNKQIELKGKD